MAKVSGSTSSASTTCRPGREFLFMRLRQSDAFRKAPAGTRGRCFDDGHRAMVLLNDHLIACPDSGQHGMDIVRQFCFCDTNGHPVFDHNGSGASPRLRFDGVHRLHEANSADQTPGAARAETATISTWRRIVSPSKTLPMIWSPALTSRITFWLSTA